MTNEQKPDLSGDDSPSPGVAAPKIGPERLADPLASSSQYAVSAGNQQDQPGDFEVKAKLYRQRYDQRKILFIAAISGTAVMLIAFIAFVVAVVTWTWLNPKERFDWHILLLGSALVLPPTFVVWNLMKQVFRSDGKLENGKEDNGGSGILWKDVIGEAIKAIKDLKDMFSKSSS